MRAEEARSAAEFAEKRWVLDGGEEDQRERTELGRRRDRGRGAVFEVGGKTQFEIEGKYIAETTVVGKNEVVMQFHSDDTVAEKDSLVEMSFYVPPGNETWAGADPEDPEDTAEKRVQAAIMSIAAADAEAGDPVADFDGVSMVVPRGKVSMGCITRT